MIQRIQSVFLLLSAGAYGGQFALPYLQADAASAGAAVPALSDGALTPTDNIGLLGLSIMGIVLALVAIFLFRNRSLQGRVAALGLLVGTLLLALAGFTTFNTLENLPNTLTAQMNGGLALPAVAAIFQWLAGRFIKKDEALVRSMDRLR